MTREEILEGLYEIKNWKCNGDAKTHEVVTETIKILEQEPVLNKIRAEIEETYMNVTYQENKDRQATWGLRKALEIIDKYRAESEE